MKKLALVLTIEQYANPQIAPVAFAQRDAQRLAKVLGLHDFVVTNSKQLTESLAAKQKIVTQIEHFTAQLAEGDVAYVYLAGRIFSQDGRNFLACGDTKPDRLAATSLAIDPLFADLLNRPLSQLVLFVDGRPISANGSFAADHFHQDSIVQAFDAAPQACCFAACQPEEESYSSGQLTHGIWAFHLAEAFDGKVPAALKRGLLTAASLQKHLEQAVPRTLRTTFSVKKEQTPWLCGGQDINADLADLRPILEARKEALGSGDDPIRQVAFVRRQAAPVKQLLGFKKSHRVPENSRGSSQDFVHKLADEEISQDIDAVYARLKSAYRLVRADADISVPGDGTGTIITPYFNYSVAVSLDAQNSAEVQWTRTVDAIREPKKVNSTAFEKAFPDVFDTIECTLPTTVQLPAFIDAVEKMYNKNVQVEYDRDCRSCELRLKGFAAIIRVTAHTLEMVHRGPQSPKLLIKSFQALQQAIVKQGVPLMTLTK